MKLNAGKSLGWLIVVLVLAGCASKQEPAALSEPSASDIVKSTAQETKFVRVIDGDTIVVSVDGEDERVRLVGINTPEKGYCGFEEASNALELLLEASQVELVEAGVDDRDRYGRLLRYLDINGSDPGLELIRSGLAEAAYDSRTGFPAHDRQNEYVLADALSLNLCENG